MLGVQGLPCQNMPAQGKLYTPAFPLAAPIAHGKLEQSGFLNVNHTEIGAGQAAQSLTTGEHSSNIRAKCLNVALNRSVN